MAIPRYYVNIGSGALVRLNKVDDSFAYFDNLAPGGSHFPMAVADYDEYFVERFRPATREDLLANEGAEAIRLPKNAPDDWARTPVEAAPRR